MPHLVVGGHICSDDAGGITIKKITILDGSESDRGIGDGCQNY